MGWRAGAPVDLSDKRTSKGAQKGDILVVEEVCDDWFRYKDSWLPLNIGGVPKFQVLDGADLGAGISKQGPSLWDSSCTASVLKAAADKMSRSTPPPLMPHTSGAEEISQSAPAALRSAEPHDLTPRLAWDMIRAEAELFEQDLVIRRQCSPENRQSTGQSCSSCSPPLGSPERRQSSGSFRERRQSPGSFREPAKPSRQVQSAPAALQMAKTHGPQPHGHEEIAVEFQIHRKDSAGSPKAADGLVSHDRQSVNDETDEALLPPAPVLAQTPVPVLEHVQEVGRGTECRLSVRLSVRSEFPTSQSMSMSMGEAPGTSWDSSAMPVAEGTDGRSTLMPVPCDSPPIDHMTVPRPLHSPRAAVDSRATIHEGWVFKRSRHLGVWRRRWMVLEASGLIRCFPGEAGTTEATSEFRVQHGLEHLRRLSDGVLALPVGYMSRRQKCLRQLRNLCGLQSLESTARTVLVFDAGAAANDNWSQALARTVASPSLTGPSSGSHAQPAACQRHR
eukprot:CAMPEP_0172716248 /NCGR_PEP_ID=MMETSP1074-20121228/68004_1 /TAXON_ID=2916 /ORGANISM="Ceratium fusus, Strain PA161109" /LENGTH=504 /DNA_ID=CAMNT_0013540905 /DNA_START=89 /DNA_END=1602 /DNA_ORIENTATION=-